MSLLIKGFLLLAALRARLTQKHAMNYFLQDSAILQWQQQNPNHHTKSLESWCFLFTNTELFFSNVCQNLSTKNEQFYMFLTTMQHVSLSLYNRPNETYKRKIQLYVAAQSKT